MFLLKLIVEAELIPRQHSGPGVPLRIRPLYCVLPARNLYASGFRLRHKVSDVGASQDSVFRVPKAEV